MHFDETVKIGVREYMSLSHLWSACFFSREAERLERTDDGLPDRRERHLAYVVASIGGCADFLDATINEVLQDARDEHEGAIVRLDPTRRTLLAELPPLNQLRHVSALDKYDLALDAIQVAKIPRGNGVGQRAWLLLTAKNGMSHPVPETVTTYATNPADLEQQKLELRVASLRLPENPFAGPRSCSFRIASRATLSQRGRATRRSSSPITSSCSSARRVRTTTSHTTPVREIVRPRSHLIGAGVDRAVVHVDQSVKSTTNAEPFAGYLRNLS